MTLKISKTILLILIFAGLSSCNKPYEFFIGKWQILNVVENNEFTELGENWMHLKSNGTFESYDGDLNKSESGKWNYQSNEKTLFIDGEGEKEDSQWILSMKNDTLIFLSASDNLYLIAKKID